MTYTGYTQAGNKAAQRYRKEKRQRMTLEMSPEEMKILQKIADRTGETRTAVLKRLIKEEAKNEIYVFT